MGNKIHSIHIHMYLWSRNVHLQATFLFCTVYAVVTWWTTWTTVTLNAGEFGIHTRFAVFTASGNPDTSTVWAKLAIITKATRRYSFIGCEPQRQFVPHCCGRVWERAGSEDFALTWAWICVASWIGWVEERCFEGLDCLGNERRRIPFVFLVGKDAAPQF